MSPESQLIADAIEAGGGIGAVAKAIGLTEEGVRLWRVRGKVPDKHIVEFERLTGVPREQLRPDLYRRDAETIELDTATAAEILVRNGAQTVYRA